MYLLALLICATFSGTYSCMPLEQEVTKPTLQTASLYVDREESQRPLMQPHSLKLVVLAYVSKFTLRWRRCRLRWRHHICRASRAGIEEDDAENRTALSLKTAEI